MPNSIDLSLYRAIICFGSTKILVNKIFLAIDPLTKNTYKKCGYNGRVIEFSQLTIKAFNNMSLPLFSSPPPCATFNS